MLTFFKTLLSTLMNKGLLTGLRVQPFPNDQSQPFKTFSEALTKELSKRGVQFISSAEWACELDWEILGGSQLKIKTAIVIGPFTVKTDVREGVPEREVVDFDIDETYNTDPEVKVLMFFKKAAEKVATQLETKYQNYIKQSQ